MDSNTTLIILAIIGIIVTVIIFKLFKIPKIGGIALFTGAPGAGKGTAGHWFAYRELRKRRLKVWIYNHTFAKLPFKRKNGEKIFKERERPLLYSITPWSIPYVPLTRKILYREERMNYGSVIYIDEASLLADMMLFKDEIQNEHLTLFLKLIRHETKGGCVIWDTQSITDMHYAFKRVTSQYFYVHHTIKIPFFAICYIKECMYSEDNSVITANEQDIEESLVRIIVPKKVWKMYDSYSYSVLTDNLRKVDREIKPKKRDLKVKKFLSFRKFRTIDKEFLREE